ncbi:MAG: toll/interleukin-1 receptor domain-containing protein [Opitutus sp.]|nr:toll/interleukin-1 receptor domain-containing protein [Opitutus sp.]
MSGASKAIFLSYAREDTDAARRIADALRGFGIEVWFDQSELRGGDTWDAKIKQQIRECALFVAIVSAHTQARIEGYFRREWKLAVERTHDMAENVTFVLPIVVDDTPEKGALVPEQFLRVHWTRLPGGRPTPQFVAEVEAMLRADRWSRFRPCP